MGEAAVLPVMLELVLCVCVCAYCACVVVAKAWVLWYWSLCGYRHLCGEGMGMYGLI